MEGSPFGDFPRVTPDRAGKKNARDPRDDDDRRRPSVRLPGDAPAGSYRPGPIVVMAPRIRTLFLGALLAPALFLIAFVWFGGLASLVFQSLGYRPDLGRTGLDARALSQLLASAGFWRAFAVSVLVAASATALATVIAVGTALAVRGSLPASRTSIRIFRVQFALPHLGAALAMLLLFAQSGLLARTAQGIGLPAAGALVGETAGSPWGWVIVIEHVWKAIPIIGIVAVTVLRRIDTGYEVVARSLGAGPWQRVRLIVMPLLLPPVRSTALLVCAFILGAFEVPYLLGPAAPLPVFAWQRYAGADPASRPEAFAAAALLMCLCALFAWLAVPRRGLAEPAP